LRQRRLGVSLLQPERKHLEEGRVGSQDFVVAEHLALAKHHCARHGVNARGGGYLGNVPRQYFGGGRRGRRAVFLLFAPLDVHVHPVHVLAVGVKPVVGQFPPDVEEYGQAHEHAQGQPGNVDGGKYPVLLQVAPGDEQVVAKHRSGFTGCKDSQDRNSPEERNQMDRNSLLERISPNEILVILSSGKS
jgi:hypothetical protein